MPHADSSLISGPLVDDTVRLRGIAARHRLGARLAAGVAAAIPGRFSWTRARWLQEAMQKRGQASAWEGRAAVVEARDDRSLLPGHARVFAGDKAIGDLRAEEYEALAAEVHADPLIRIQAIKSRSKAVFRKIPRLFVQAFGRAVHVAAVAAVVATFLFAALSPAEFGASLRLFSEDPDQAGAALWAYASTLGGMLFALHLMGWMMRMFIQLPSSGRGALSIEIARRLGVRFGVPTPDKVVVIGRALDSSMWAEMPGSGGARITYADLPGNRMEPSENGFAIATLAGSAAGVLCSHHVLPSVANLLGGASPSWAATSLLACMGAALAAYCRHLARGMDQPRRHAIEKLMLIALLSYLAGLLLIGQFGFGNPVDAIQPPPIVVPGPSSGFH